MEAKEHDLVFDDDDDDSIEDEPIEAKVHETVKFRIPTAEDTRKLYEGEGVDFDQILQAQKANTRIQVKMHSIEEDSESDEEYTGIEINSHWWKPIPKEEEEDEDEILLDMDLDNLLGLSTGPAAVAAPSRTSGTATRSSVSSPLTVPTTIGVTQDSEENEEASDIHSYQVPDMFIPDEGGRAVATKTTSDTKEPIEEDDFFMTKEELDAANYWSYAQRKCGLG